MHLKSLIIVVSIISSFLRIYSQSIVIVIQDNTQNAIEGAIVFEKEMDATYMSNKEGTCSMKIPLNKKQLFLKVERIGYEVLDTLVVIQNTNIPIVLSLKSNTLINEVEVVGMRAVTRKAATIVPLSQIKNTPVLFGEPDIFKTLQTLPGIKFSVEGTSDFVVRGGNVGENLILIDGFPTNISSHLLGLISPIDADLVKSVNVYKGGIPAKFSGKLSSVIDIQTQSYKDIVSEMKLRVGLLSSSLVWSNKIGKRLAFNFVARRTLLDLFSKGKSAILQENGKVTPFFYDLYGKISYTLSSRWTIDLSANQNKDYFNQSNSDEERIFSENSNWKTPSIRSQIKYKDAKKEISLGASYNVYNYNFLMRQESSIVKDSIISNDLFYNTNTKNLLLKLEGTYRFNDNISMSMGSKYDIGKYAYTFNRYDVKLDTLNLASKFLNNYASLDVEYSNFSVNAGLNTFFSIPALAFKTYLEPRLYADYNYKSSKIFATFTKGYQSDHLASNRSIVNYLKIWVPSGVRNIVPSSSISYSLGYKYTKQNLEFTAEVYNKIRSNLIHPKEGDLLFISNANINQLLNNGKGNSYGFELNTVYQFSNKLTINAAYTWSKSELLFASLNRGKAFPDYYDRRHTLYIGANHVLSNKWTINAGFSFSSGNPFTYLNGIYPSAGYKADDLLGSIFSNGSIVPYVVFNVPSLNNKRVPDFHRLDITAEKKISFRGHSAALAFGVYNIYARKNPMFIRPKLVYNTIWNGNIGKPYVTGINYEIVSYFNFIPFISFQVDFKNSQ